MLCFHKFHSDDGMTGFRLGEVLGGTSEFDPIRIEDFTGLTQRLPDFGEALLENFAVIAYDNCIGINTNIVYYECPILFKSRCAVTVLKMDLADVENLIQILSATGLRYFVFPAEFGTLLVYCSLELEPEIVYSRVMYTEKPGVYTAWFDTNA